MMARQTRSEATRRKILNTFRSNCEASSPAMENMIHGTFVVADTLGSDEVARAAEQLTLALGGFNEAASRVCTNWVEAMAAQGRRAIVEGDLREDLDPETVAESIVGAMFGAQSIEEYEAQRSHHHHHRIALARDVSMSSPMSP
jgi:hypothetical protein